MKELSNERISNRLVLLFACVAQLGCSGDQPACQLSVSELEQDSRTAANCQNLNDASCDALYAKYEPLELWDRKSCGHSILKSQELIQFMALKADGASADESTKRALLQLAARNGYIHSELIDQLVIKESEYICQPFLGDPSMKDYELGDYRGIAEARVAAWGKGRFAECMSDGILEASAQYHVGKDETVDEKLKFMSQTVNAALPIKMDELTRFDSIDSPKSKVLKYKYTISDPEQLDMDLFSGILSDQLPHDHCFGLTGRPPWMFGQGIRFSFQYADNDGREIAKTEFSCDDS